MPQKISLRHIIYHPTFNCNLSCRGCVNYSNHLETRKIPDEENWKRDLTNLFDRFDVAHIEIAGGEPLMFPHLFDVIKTFSPAKRYTVTTNGLLLYKNKWLKELIDTDPKFQITISLHYDPKNETIYTKNLCNSISEFLDLPTQKVKTLLSRYSISADESHSIYKGVGIMSTYPNSNGKQAWKFPLLDSNELPIKFNNDSSKAYSSCICPNPHLKDGKIYKCPMTAMLLKVVESKNLYNDSWKFLKDYKPYDLIGDHNVSDWSRISMPEDVCSNCPVAPHEWETSKTDIHSKIVKFK
jgi:MoaA/NifB/PqqE/SkfB family radical SAM enzyme